MGLLNGCIKSAWNRPHAKRLCLSCYAWRTLYILYKPLRTFSGGIRYVVVGGGRFRSLSRWNREQRTEPHALSRGPMTIALVTTGLLACAFYIYVLCQWMRDANGKGRRTSPPPIAGQSGATQQNNRVYIMGSRKHAQRHSPDVSSRRVMRMTGGSRGGGLGWNESERIAYQKIASSLSLRKRG